MTPALRAWMISQKDEQASGYYDSRRKKSDNFYLWLLIVIAALLALLMTGHDRTPGKSADETIITWSDSGWDRMAFIVDECANPTQIVSQLDNPKRKK